MPKWMIKWATRIVLQALLRYLRNYMTKEEHAKVVANIKTKVDIRS